MDRGSTSATPEPRAFAAKIDMWILVLVAGSSIVCLFVSASVVVSEVPGRYMIAVVLLVSSASSLWILLSTSYTLHGGELRVRCGPFRWTVPLSEIRDVRSTRNPLSSPAPSLDRLRIDYGTGRWIMISPCDKQSFLRELEARRSGPRPS